LGECGLDWSVSKYGFCEHGSGHSGNKEHGEFDNLRGYFLLKVGCVPWSSTGTYNFSVNISNPIHQSHTNQSSKPSINFANVEVSTLSLSMDVSHPVHNVYSIGSSTLLSVFGFISFLVSARQLSSPWSFPPRLSIHFH
jgi:hypothetical protein